MRFVWAVAAFVIAALMIVAGIAQRTVFQGPKTDTVALSTSQEAPFTMIDGAVLTQTGGTQTLRAEGDGTIFVSYGRTADMKAWLGKVPHNEITLTAGGSIASQFVEPTAEATTTTAPSAIADAGTDAGAGTDAATDAASTALSPVGSDLWLDEFQQDDLLIAPLQLPDTMSVLVASDGTQPAPSDISITWPTRGATPWAGPLIVGGSILMVAGVILYVLAIRNLRRSRGPRRKAPPPLPETEPIDIAAEGGAKGVISSTRRRPPVTERRAWVAVPALAVSALLFTGCSADAWPQWGGSPTASPSASVVIPEGQQQPAVTETQAERILSRISSTVADADTKMDQSVAATRLDGAMLAERTTNYALRAKIADRPALAAIPAEPIAVVLPQATNGWPRTVMTIVKDAADATVAPRIMLMTQQDPWSEYKLTYSASLEAAAVVPDLAPSYVGASQVQPDSPFLVMQPDKVAAAYADVLNNGENSTQFSEFDTDSDQFRVGVANSRKERLDEFNQTASTTGTLTFAAAAGSTAPLALATIESGAIVAVQVTESDLVKPTSADAVIKLTNNPTVSALTGVTESATGFSSTYSDQLFFYVPGQGSTDKIRLLGYASEFLDAQVIK